MPCLPCVSARGPPEARREVGGEAPQRRRSAKNRRTTKNCRANSCFISNMTPVDAADGTADTYGQDSELRITRGATTDTDATHSGMESPSLQGQSGTSHGALGAGPRLGLGDRCHVLFDEPFPKLRVIERYGAFPYRPAEMRSTVLPVIKSAEVNQPVDLLNSFCGSRDGKPLESSAGKVPVTDQPTSASKSSCRRWGIKWRNMTPSGTRRP